MAPDKSLLVKIGNRLVGPGQACFVIAEAGINHNGDFSLARRLVEAAAEAGADAVKFQTFKTENLVSRTARKGDYQIERTGGEETQFEMLKKVELRIEQHQELMRLAKERGLIFLSTPFDEESGDLLHELGVPAYKLSSGDLTNTILLQHLAKFDQPLILSTGMADLEETREACEVVRAQGVKELVVLHCVTNYPTDPADCNLRAMQTMREALGVPIGFSDHTLGCTIGWAAVAMGACVMEKHLTLDRSMPGPDHFASLAPQEFKEFVAGIRAIEIALGNGEKIPAASERSNAEIGRKSLHWKSDLPAGAKIELKDLIALRPSTGIKPKDRVAYVGGVLTRPVQAGTMVQPEDFAAAS